ncbi:MAG TPA: tRNA 4-thiouridine(8) synthase ThiI [Clostridiales bacterium]|jgi:thiamine biosynthesis protein ThiI|nr:tRNA 4-thiouridine(8) synthase ThiI [Clostridiales bacterium]
MYNNISMSLGEIVLKGRNRGYFENKLNQSLKRVIDDKEIKIYRDRGKVFLDIDDNIDKMVRKISKVFGIVVVSPCVKIESDLEDIKNTVVEYVNFKKESRNIKTFKIKAKRADKTFPVKSMDLNNILGGEVLKNVEDIKVDVHNPDLIVNVDIRSKTYIYSEKYQGGGGLPIGSNGRGLVLLSGGIDSPVAGYLMGRRGVKVDCISFHSYPYTSIRSNEKIKELSDIMSVYTGPMKVYFVNILEIYRQIKEKCQEKNTTIIARRFMMKISEKIAQREEYDCLVTGESLGQVASQTINSLRVIENSVDIPILRPLIGNDKTEIIDTARDIETYEISIQPYDDCCSIFSPDNPVTRPNLDNILEDEKNLDVEKLVEETIENSIEIYNTK